jgi:hypothetical protein
MGVPDNSPRYSGGCGWVEPDPGQVLGLPRAGGAAAGGVLGKLPKPTLHRRGLRLEVGDGLRDVPRGLASVAALEVTQHVCCLFTSHPRRSRLGQNPRWSSG